MNSDILGELLQRNKELEEQFIRATDSAMQLLKIDKEHQRINGELREENKRLNNIINEALGIANERVNYYHYINNKEQLENWEDIFNALVKRDSDKE